MVGYFGKLLADPKRWRMQLSTYNFAGGAGHSGFQVPATSRASSSYMEDFFTETDDENVTLVLQMPYHSWS